MKIFLASDHAGFELKGKLIAHLKHKGFDTVDEGPFSYDKEDDYPDFISRAAHAVSQNPDDCAGIIVGGGGQGEAITANRFPHVRAAVFYGPMSPLGTVDIEGRRSADTFENVRLSRTHNNANVLSIAARFVEEKDAHEAVRIFLETPFGDEERHTRRIRKIEEVSRAIR